jgi:WD40 repeat protein
LRPDLLAFRTKHFGTQAAVEAAGLLSQIPSPLDKLDPAKIPAIERFDWQPQEPLLSSASTAAGRRAVTCVAVTPDGKTVISGGGSLVRFWDAATMRQRAMVSHYVVHAMSLSKDGKTATAGSDAHARIRTDAREAEAVARDSPPAPRLYAVALGAQRQDRRGWRRRFAHAHLRRAPPKDNKERLSLGGNTKPVAALVFAPDGKTLVSGGHDATVRGWDVVSTPDRAKELFILEGHAKLATSLAYSPDGRTLAVGCEDGAVRLWNMTTAKPSARTPAVGKGGRIYGVAYHPKLPQIAAASADGKVHFWDVGVTPPRDRGTPAEGHINYASAVAYFPSGATVATGSADWTVRLWNVPVGGGKPTQKFDLKGHLSHVYTSLFTPDGLTVATGSYDRRVRLWSVDRRSRRSVRSSSG